MVLCIILNKNMIDNNIINKTVNSIIDSLETANHINDQLSLLDNPLPAETINKLRILINKRDTKWKLVAGQEDFNREMIDWIPESIIEELHMTCDILTEDIKQYFGIDDISFQALQLWKDSKDYNLGSHKDNPVIDVAMQIYLFGDGLQTEGTTFFIKEGKIDVPFKSNTGYLLWKKSNEDRIKHQITNIVTDRTRYTLYLTWSRFGKQAPDANDPAAFL
jgi:hypothetical protein